MRKINDQELMNMIEAGKSQKECAEYFQTSPSAINQRVKKLQTYAPPASFKHLTTKEQSFVLAKVEGKTNLEAVKSAYDVTTNESAKSLGTVLMKDPDIGTAIQDLMAQEGIPRRRRVQRLRDMIECPDLSIVGKGLDMANKLDGSYAPQQVEVLTGDEIRRILDNLPPIIDITPENAD